MVKADLTRDYYADLELSPTADAAEIVKQFRKLAFKHHPDRNPGREAEVLPFFQRIQSAHEVLSDVQERAKYDSNRIRASSVRNGHANYSSGASSGMRGNPWSGVSSQYPTPPKPPTRARPTTSTPSAGAQRYTNNFKPPSTSAYQAAQNEPNFRQDTFNAFDRVRHRPPPGAPPKGTPKSGREESNAQAKAEAEKAEAERVRAETERARSNARPGFNEYREPNSSQHRSPSKGFQPNTPGGDEPPAPRGAYSTSRNKPMAPPPPPRQPPAPFATFVTPDPLQQFRKTDMPSTETRSSQPYNTHGGEKFSLHGSPNVSRSKSTREGSRRFDEGQAPTNVSDSNSNTPQRSRSSGQRSARPVQVDSSSSDDLPDTGGAKSGSSATNKSNESAAEQAESARKQSKIEKLRQWMAENPGREPPPNGFPADGPPLRSSQTNPKLNGKTTGAAVNGSTNGQPNMYANFAHLPFTSKNACPTPVFASNSPQPSFPPRNVSQKDDITKRERSKYYAPYPELVQGMKVSAKAASELADGPQILNPFEKTQQNIVNQLISSKRTGSYSQKLPVDPVALKSNFPTRSDKQTSVRESAGLESPSKKFRRHASSVPPFDEARAYWQQNQYAEKTANHVLPTRFSFPITKDTFTSTQAQANGFNSSAENISTKFTPEDWDGTFAAGNDYFQPTGAVPRADPRAQSGSHARGRSPSKVRPAVDPKFTPSTESENPIESPGETRFSAEEWKETFKPQTFMPPTIPHRTQPGRKRTIPSMRSTMSGRAAIIDEGDNPDEKPLFDGPRASSPEIIFPDLMDVDTPPAPRVVPQFAPTQANGDLNGDLDPSKRPATSSTPSPIDQENLAVNFDDLKIKRFNLEMPAPPMPPTLPELTDFEVPSRESFDSYLERYAAYMSKWDAVYKQYLLHFVERKNYSKNMEDMRWTNKTITDDYRLSLKQDQAVLQEWADNTKKHENVVSDYVIWRERMASKQAEVNPRSRKKVC